MPLSGSNDHPTPVCYRLCVARVQDLPLVSDWDTARAPDAIKMDDLMPGTSDGSGTQPTLRNGNGDVVVWPDDLRSLGSFTKVRSLIDGSCAAASHPPALQHTRTHSMLRCT